MIRVCGIFYACLSRDRTLFLEGRQKQQTRKTPGGDVGTNTPPSHPLESTSANPESINHPPARPAYFLSRNNNPQEDGPEQALPVAFASTFPLWVIDGEVDRAGRKQVTQVPGASEELGWVDPRRCAVFLQPCTAM